MAQVSPEIKTDMSQIERAASLLDRMADFLRDNPDHELASRMAAHGEIKNGRDFHIDTDTSHDPLTVSASVTYMGPFADIVRDFEALQ